VRLRNNLQWAAERQYPVHRDAGSRHIVVMSITCTRCRGMLFKNFEERVIDPTNEMWRVWRTWRVCKTPLPSGEICNHAVDRVTGFWKPEERR
jgi:hypothetical protein